ncbi:hypothetical protein B9Z65_749 [Elsinoe australis]|uniref:Uncharacterized protein n=1 Tax=Elsinoe australis TaxID=40998 RepID=A0A2P8AJI4_9PEZI|nr:hypothetical protein B9Z65_749 [Elsinoe australis]
MAEDDDALHYLPPGWTEEQYQNATDEDFENLPDEVLERNMKRMAAESALQSQRRLTEINERRAARGAPSIEQARKERGKAGHPVVRLVESKGWDDFGFMLFRMDYSDDARWERFMEVYDQMLESSMDEAEAGSGIERIRDKLFTKFVDDDIVDGSGIVGVARAFQMFKEEGEVEPGLDTKMCLMADEECFASVLDPRSAEDKLKTPPFLKAVDVDMASGNFAPTADYSGHFKVSIAALVMEFFLALHEFGHPSELAPFADPIWQDRLGSP